MPNSKSTAYSPIEMLKPSNQIPHLKFELNQKPQNGELSVKLAVPWKLNIGPSPLVRIAGSSLALCGAATNKIRGLNIIKWAINNTTREFATLKLAVNRTDQHDLYEMCHEIIKQIAEKKDPVHHSKWWESKFPNNLSNGTQVYEGTKEFQHIGDMLSLEIPSDSWNAPARTFGKFLFSENEDDSTWYTEISLPQTKKGEDSRPERLVLYDEKGKMIGNRTDSNGNEVYPKGGIELTNTKLLRDLVESKFYKEGIWKCDTHARIFKVVIKYCAMANAAYPVFKMSTVGDVKFQLSSKKLDPNQLSSDQIMASLNGALYEGVTPPSRKKRKIVKAKKMVSKQGKIESEAISESDVEGDDDDE